MVVICQLRSGAQIARREGMRWPNCGRYYLLMRKEWGCRHAGAQEYWRDLGYRIAFIGDATGGNRRLIIISPFAVADERCAGGKNSNVCKGNPLVAISIAA